ncbi:Autotransporter-associated beta strand repeat protein [Posidoniimonas corsicana]|uniref:Probable pectate lyase C n=1 Tax=Posidoniimonas corsicana TaxID=1938618 RepID=A0A5C5V417_9BACT|nr:autotransporter-associated beta strand repeat-containing protein [Posidoniimonas corsicana]TWT32497.1 Autotransporter-associated beta strand repeat protein [Posidoniimonas corsicana]
MNRAFATLLAVSLLGPAAAAQTLAFPEAEGFGRYATGARTNLSAASVYHVTNLNDSGPGSFRDAVSQSNRFVVFDVGGIANIESVVTVASNITIAGQTAPGGFTLYSDRISFTNSHNLISRHFAVRKGDPGVRDDAASIARGTNMIFDHMSITWGVDGTFDINHDSGHVIDDITIQNSIIAQGLDRLGHSTGGLMQPGEGGSVSVIKSLWADNVTRNPKVRFENEFINNVVYGYENAGYIMGDTSNADSYANVEGNYFIEGPVNGSSPFTSGTSRFHIYANDNWVDGDRDGVLDGSLNTSYPGADVVSTRHAFPTTAGLTAQQAVSHVMANAGPNITRDAVDARLMQEVGSYGTLGGVIQRETDLFPGFGSDPVYLNPRARLVDADYDGMLDNWESANGLSPTNPNDWKNVSRGYTSLEHYLNELGADGAPVASTGGAWTSAASWAGGVPTLADDATTDGAVTHSAGHAFARRLHAGAGLSVSGGTLDVFDTLYANGAVDVGGGVVSAGRVVMAASRQSGVIALSSGGVLRTAAVAADGAGSPSLSFDGGEFHALDAPSIAVPVSLGAGGGVVDTAGYSGAVSGSISGVGGLTKRGGGALALTGGKTYTGPTVVEQGQLVVQGAGLGATSVHVAAGASLDVASASGPLNLASGKTLSGSGTVVGSVVAAAGSVVRPEGAAGGVGVNGAVGIQAEDLSLGADWAVFSNATHGTGAGGSYNGADLTGGGIVMIAGESLAAPSASGSATATIDIPQAGTYYLFAKIAEPSNSPIPGDSSTSQGGNNSFWASGSSNNVHATTSNFEEVQTYANPGDAATWNRVSPSLASLDGVVSPLNAGIDYSLSAGPRTFTIYGREVGTVIDGFVLANQNLTAEQLEAALSASGDQNLTINGGFTLAADALFDLQLGSEAPGRLSVAGTATLSGDLSVSLADGFTPQASDVFEILDATALTGQFANAAPGARLTTAGGLGSFLVGYDYANDLVTLSDFAAGLAGDFNSDGVVNAADYTVWRDSMGDQASYLLWRNNYGATAPAPGAAAAAPEPAALLLAALALLPLLCRR